MKAEFTHHDCRAFLKKVGARQVSDEAVEELRVIVEEIVLDVARRALLFAEDGRRLKVLPEDVRNAKKEFLKLHRWKEGSSS